MYRVTLVVALLFVLPAFLPGPAYAQVDDIIDEFCQETEQNIDDSFDELQEARLDIEECADEFEDCLTGVFVNDPADCTRQYVRCVDRGFRDQEQACTEFARGFRDGLGDALRRARRQGVQHDELAHDGRSDGHRRPGQRADRRRRRRSERFRRGARRRHWPGADRASPATLRAHGRRHVHTLGQCEHARERIQLLPAAGAVERQRTLGVRRTHRGGPI